ncbi:hypothetical protein Fcan01_22458 [Folsomia candida]|uniref:Uncharacterized protein n=1 Tax=Folsomia candida TaxID=158441 RepID=A0A226DD13_FOLCA|nr:hypothetical protein Fcan01_22458 [Folsomia candida]
MPAPGGAGADRRGYDELERIQMQSNQIVDEVGEEMVGIRVEVWGQAGGKGVKGNEEERVMPEGGLTKVGLGAVVPVFSGWRGGNDLVSTNTRHVILSLLDHRRGSPA